jgi:signal peptidase I
MNQGNESKNLKGTWTQAILTFLFPILLVLGVRWALYEPFVIPSGSMIPNLLVHDHILVQKFAFGLHLPFSDKWLLQWHPPQRGDIVVFKYPDNPDIYYIKRLIGLPGDEVQVLNGHITVNGKKWPLESFAKGERSDPNFAYYKETISNIEGASNTHLIRFMKPEVLEGIKEQTFVVPAGMFFFMGDNRDQSSDSRFWGYVKNDYIVGKAWLIWLSCDSTLPSMSFVCDPSQIRWSRLIKVLN